MTVPDAIRERKPRILVTDAMPVNGGDEALLVGLLRGLENRWPGAQVTVLSARAAQGRKILPEVPIEPALGSTGIFRWMRRRRGLTDGHGNPLRGVLERLACFLEEQLISRRYREADIVVSAPGGFLSDHYDITSVLRGFELAARLGKPLVLFGQSIGPLTGAANRAALARALAGAALIAVRDQQSRHCLAECGIEGSRVVFMPDVAFLWRGLARSLYRNKSGPPKSAGLCFRRWPYHDREEYRKTVAKARRLVEHLASRGIERFLFASTCQGVPGYVDDSELSVLVVSGLAPELQDRCTVDRMRYHPCDLIRLLSGCDIFIGMRLHSCLLAMLGGTPAVGLAYEQKTPEIFRQLGLKTYQVPFTAYQTRWCACASRLIDDLDAVRKMLPSKLDLMYRRAEEGLSLLDAFLPR